MPLITNGKVSVGSSPPLSSLGLIGEGWTSFLFRIHDFAVLSSTKGHSIETPEFTCNGHHFLLNVYPGGDSEADEGYVSAYLWRLSEEKVMVDFAIGIIDKFGKPRKSGRSKTLSKNCGWKHFIPRSDILDESKHMLDSDGCLNIVVSIKQDPTTVFVPKNPLLSMIKEMFNDEATADVRFEVGNCIGGSDQRRQKKQKSAGTFIFHAHRLILMKCAPILADLLGDNDTATINDMKPEIFRHLLSYIYGCEVPREELRKHAKDIIHAADKYAVVNLKLTAEAAYVESTEFTFENAIDNLLYADGKNCALLKEKVLGFLSGNHCQAAEKVSFADCPGHIMRDLFDAISRVGKDGSSAADADELTNLCVSSLRKKLDGMGLEVDGSRETMIEAIKNSNKSS